MFSSAEHLLTARVEDPIWFPEPTSDSSQSTATPAPRGPTATSGLHVCPYTWNIHTENKSFKNNPLVNKQAKAPPLLKGSKWQGTETGSVLQGTVSWIGKRTTLRIRQATLLRMARKRLTEGQLRNDLRKAQALVQAEYHQEFTCSCLASAVPCDASQAGSPMEEGVLRYSFLLFPHK